MNHVNYSKNESAKDITPCFFVQIIWIHLGHSGSIQGFVFCHQIFWSKSTVTRSNGVAVVAVGHGSKKFVVIFLIWDFFPLQEMVPSILSFFLELNAVLGLYLFFSIFSDEMSTQMLF